MSFCHLANFSLSESFCFKYVSHIWQRVVLCLRAKVKIFSFYLGAFWLIYISISLIFSVSTLSYCFTLFFLFLLCYIHFTVFHFFLFPIENSVFHYLDPLWMFLSSAISLVFKSYFHIILCICLFFNCLLNILHEKILEII